MPHCHFCVFAIVRCSRVAYQVTVTWEITGFKGTYKMGAVVEFPQHADESSPASVEDLLVSLEYN